MKTIATPYSLYQSLRALTNRVSNVEQNVATIGPTQRELHAAMPYLPSMLPWQGRRVQDSLTPSARNIRIACIGDSTVRGVNTTEESTRPAMHLYSWPYLLAKKLNAMGINATNDSIWGSGGSSFGSTPSLLTYDTRLTRSGTGITTSESSLGGQSFSGSASGSITFAPANPVSKFDIHWIKNSGLGTFSYAIDGGAATNVPTAGTKGTDVTTVDCGGLGTHTITIAWVSGTFYVRGLDGYDHTKNPRQISVWNFGIRGGTSNDMVGTGNPWSPESWLSGRLQPDLSIIEGGIINDWRNALGVSVTSANLRKIVIAAKAAGGSAVLLTPTWDSATGPDEDIQEQYVDAMWAIAAEQNVPVIDWRSLLVSHTVGTAAALIDDSVHPTFKGYSTLADLIAKAIV